MLARCVAIVCLSLYVMTPFGYAQTSSTWTAATGGDWNTGTNWTNGVPQYPNWAVFLKDTPAISPLSITVSSGPNLSGILSSHGNVQISGSSFTMVTDDSNPFLTLNGTNTYTQRLTLNNNLNVVGNLTMTAAGAGGSGITLNGIVLAGSITSTAASGATFTTNRLANSSNSFTGAINVYGAAGAFNALEISNEGALGNTSGIHLFTGGVLRLASGMTMSKSVTFETGTFGAMVVLPFSDTVDWTGSVVLQENGTDPPVNGTAYTQSGSTLNMSGNISESGSGSSWTWQMNSSNNSVTASGNNTYTGRTYINVSTSGQTNNIFTVGSTTAIPTLSTLQIDNGVQVNLNGHSITIGGLAGITSSNSTIQLGSQILTFGGNNESNSFLGKITGSGSVIKEGTGAQTIAYAVNSDYTGQTTINSGSVVVRNNVTNGVAGALGAGTQNVLLGDTSGTSNAALLINPISGFGDVTFAKSITVQSGSSGTATIGLGKSFGETLPEDDALISGNITLDKSVILTSAASRTLTISGNITGNGGVTISDTGLGSGTVVLSGTNSYLGGTTLNAGTLTLGANNTLPTGGTVTINGGTLNFGSFTQSIGTLIQNGGIVTNFNDSGGASYEGNSGTVSDVGGASTTLTKTGSGELSLEGTNTFGGATTVTNGTLKVEGTVSGTSGTTVTGSGILAGHGSITSGTLDINSGGTVSPGGSTGTLTVSNTIFGENGNFLFEINDASGTAGSTTDGWDLLLGDTITTMLSVTATTSNPFTIQIVSLNAFQNAGQAQNFDNSQSYQWELAQFDGGVSGFAANKFTLDTSGFANDLGTGHFYLSADTTHIYVNFTPVPEPSTLLGIGAISLLGIRVVRRNSGRLQAARP